MSSGNGKYYQQAILCLRGQVDAGKRPLMI
jgi:hypothetical protein